MIIYGDTSVVLRILLHKPNPLEIYLGRPPKYARFGGGEVVLEDKKGLSTKFKIRPQCANAIRRAGIRLMPVSATFSRRKRFSRRIFSRFRNSGNVRVCP